MSTYSFSTLKAVYITIDFSIRKNIFNVPFHFDIMNGIVISYV